MNLEELERLAKEADKGPWEFCTSRLGSDFATVKSDDSTICLTPLYSPDEEQNLRYIAAINPKVILEMIEEIKKLRSESNPAPYEPINCQYCESSDKTSFHIEDELKWIYCAKCDKITVL